ncbi:ABC transporter ATP-binding protein [Nocardioides sp. Bht2]|uniref:ABC transporter ATP-binding protein n=1 Tax=Nocardioides sp. Bht2 TaxID=3392297 RepID=UPI0039B3D31F
MSDPQNPRAAALLEVEDLHVTFGRKHKTYAVNGVSFTVNAGETLALVGESGSGKSTTARAALHLETPDRGRVRLMGRDLAEVRTRELRSMRRHAQMVFQDPYSSLDPSMTIMRIVEEPLRVHTAMSRDERRERVVEVLGLCGVPAAHLHRFPGEFSGGQRQRIAIARAIATNPELVVADEAVSALDVSIRNQILNLFEDLQRKLGIAYLFITHDLGVVEQVAHRVAIMYLGRIVELGPTAEVFAEPRHPYTRALLDARPDLTRDVGGVRQTIQGDPPDPTDLVQGCAFAGRCPYAVDLCREVTPASIEIDGRESACHLDGRLVAEVPGAEPSGAEPSGAGR